MTMIWTIVRFNWEGDGFTGLYDPWGELQTEGDEYHDDIITWIEGFFEGLEYHGHEPVKRRKLYVSADDMPEDVYHAPSCLEDIEWPMEENTDG